MATRRSRYTPRLVRDPRGMQAARFTAGMGKAFADTLGTIAKTKADEKEACLLYTSPSPRDRG